MNNALLKDVHILEGGIIITAGICVTSHDRKDLANVTKDQEIERVTWVIYMGPMEHNSPYKRQKSKNLREYVRTQV